MKFSRQILKINNNNNSLEEFIYIGDINVIGKNPSVAQAAK